MKKIIVITGTPSSGKTTISEKAAGKIKDCQLIKANELVKKRKLFTSYSKDGTMIADMRKLKFEIEKDIASSDAQVVIVEGHLLCDMRIKDATAVVIREHLSVLLSRMKKRGYDKKKIEDNIVSEAIDYCGVNSSHNYRKVYEVFSPDAMNCILGIVKGRSIKTQDIELLDELNKFRMAYR